MLAACEQAPAGHFTPPDVDAELKFGFTRIISPIDGIAGMAIIQVGDLVGPSGLPLTTVSTVESGRKCRIGQAG